MPRPALVLVLCLTAGCASTTRSAAPVTTRPAPATTAPITTLPTAPPTTRTAPATSPAPTSARRATTTLDPYSVQRVLHHAPTGNLTRQGEDAWTLEFDEPIPDDDGNPAASFDAECTEDDGRPGFDGLLSCDISAPDNWWGCEPAEPGSRDEYMCLPYDPPSVYAAAHVVVLTGDDNGGAHYVCHDARQEPPRRCWFFAGRNWHIEMVRVAPSWEIVNEPPGYDVDPVVVQRLRPT